MKKNICNCALAFLMGNIIFYLWNKIFKLKECEDDKNKKYHHLFDNWLILAERGEKIEDYFRIRNIKEIAIYGYGNIGRHLITQLSNTDIVVKYVIDKRKGRIMTDNIECYQVTEHMPDTDAVVITPICEYKEIKNALEKRCAIPVISIEDIIYEML